MKCPVCGEETIRMKCVNDEQGDGAWTASMVIFDDLEQECDCVLTEEQTNHIIETGTCAEEDFSAEEWDH